MIGTILWAIIGGTIIGILGRMILPGRQNISVWSRPTAGRRVA